MFYVLCFYFIFIALGNAVDRTAEITWGQINKGENYPGITISNPGKSKTDIKWNKPLSAKLNALKATYKFSLLKTKTTQHGEIENLCEPLENGSLDEVKRSFILATLANTNSCPVQKGTTVTYSVPYTNSHAVDMELECGNFIGEFIVFKKSDEDNLHQIVSSSYGGNITGC